MSYLELIKNNPEFSKLSISHKKLEYYSELMNKAAMGDVSAPDVNYKELIEEVKVKVNNEAMNKLISDCALDALKKELTSEFRNYWRGVIHTEDFVKEFPAVKIAEEATEEKFNTDYIFMTVNPRSEVGLTEFKKAIEKMMSKVWIEQYLYVIEQRGENEEEAGKGYHFHALIYRKGKKFNELNREFKSSMKKITNVDKWNTFQISICSENDIKKRVNYMIGRKSDESKWLKQDIDKVFRKKYNLQDYYEKTKEGIEDLHTLS